MKLSRVEHILKKFTQKNILVFGDVGVDQYTIGKVTRISPEAPIPIVEVTDVSYKLGLAANVADNVAALGGQVHLVGVVGDDYASEIFDGLLKTRGITKKYLVTDLRRPTTMKERVVAETQQLLRIDHESKQLIDSKTYEKIKKNLTAALKKAHCVVIEDYCKGLVSISLCQWVIEQSRSLGVPVLVDPNSRTPLEYYRGCTLATPNTSEAEALSGVRIKDEKSLALAGERLLERLDSTYVIITRGKDGMAIFGRQERGPVLMPTFAREVFDVSGAGDTVIATLALALVSKASIVEAAHLANYAAGVEVGKRGTATVTQKELKDYINMVSKGVSRGLSV